MMIIDKVTTVVVFFKDVNGKKGKIILKNVLPTASITAEKNSPLKFECEVIEAKFVKIK